MTQADDPARITTMQPMLKQVTGPGLTGDAEILPCPSCGTLACLCKQIYWVKKQ